MSDTPSQPDTGDRLAKVMSRAGLCSRRDAEGWITAGRVTVNGKKVLTPAFNVTDRDKIEVDGTPLAARQGTRLWLYHKPPGLVVTEKDPEGRPTIFEALEEHDLPRVVTVGRLDINTEGLLLLTNDGGLKRVLELPSTGWLRRYRVRAHGTVTQAQLDGLKDGITVEGIQYGPIEATLEREQGANVWLVLGLREGKNREVKNVLSALGLEVNRLIRVSYGPFQLGDLAVGAVDVVRAKMLKDQLGNKLAEAAGVDFDSELPEGGRPARRPGPPTRASGRPGSERFDPRGGRSAPRGRDEGPDRRARTVHFDEDGRAPESFIPKGPGRPRFDRDDQPASTFGQRPPRPDRPDRAGSKKSFGDRPPRRDGDKPARSGYGDRPARSGADRPKRDFGDRPQRSFGDKPQRGPRPDRGFEDRGSGRPQRDYGDRPARGARTERPAEDRPKRPYGDRPQRSFGDKPARGNFGDRPDRPARDGKPFAGRPGGGQRPTGDRPGGARPAGGKPFAGKPFGAKPGGSRSSSARPSGGRPTGGKPFGAKPGGPRPTGGRPGGARPSGGRPTGPRKPRG